MAGTFGQLKAKLGKWMREPVDDDLANDAINDAIDSLFKACILVNLGMFFKGPVQNVTIASGTERATIVVVPNPVTQPIVANFAAGALPVRPYQAVYTLVTESGSETLVSAPLVGNSVLNNILQFSCPVLPGSIDQAIGWNLYVGSTSVNRRKQNKVPLAFGQVWSEPEDAGFSIDPALPGPPVENTTADNICFIRNLQLQTPNGAWKTLAAADIDSALMNALSLTAAVNSPYQNYAYDLVNQRTLEIRPAAGGDLNPRYFYIAKPRRISYDNAQIPFTTFDPEAYLRFAAISMLKLSVDEFDSYQAYKGEAAEELNSIIQLLGMEQWNKDTTVQPFMR